MIVKHERCFIGFDDKIIAMHARGVTVRKIQGFLAEMYAVDVSPELISSVTDAVISPQLRKIIKTRGHFPSDQAATKLIWLALRNITADWGRAAHNWK